MKGRIRNRSITEHTALMASFALVGGVAFGGWERSEPLILLIIASLGAVALKKSPSARAVMIAAFAIGAALMWRHDNAPPSPDHISRHIPKGKASVTAEVVETELVRPGSKRYLLSLITVDGEARSGFARWYFSGSDFVPLPGDVLKMTNARLREIRGYRNIGGWDYERYMKDHGIGATLSTYADSGIRLDGSRFTWRRPLERLRNRLRENLEFERYDVTAAARAMLIGDKGYLTPKLRDTFSRAGTAHLLAVSGLHVGFVATAAYFIVKLISFTIIYPLRYRWASAGVPTNLAAVAALVAAVSFGLLTGPMIPAQRATIMVSAYLLAVIAGRGRDFYGAFALALAAMLIYTPWALFEAGFQLSFAAVFSIVIFMERFIGKDEENVNIKPISGLVRRAPVLSGYFLVSIFAAAGAAPLVAYHFNIIPSYGAILNAALVPLASATVPLGLLASFGVSETILHAAEQMTAFIVDLSRLVENLPGSYSYIPDIPPFAVALFYMIFAAFLFSPKGETKRAAMIAIGAVAALGVTGAGVFIKDKLDDGLTVRFLDVGQGDCTVITWPEGVIVVDGANSYPSFDLGRSIVAPVLWKAGKTGITAMIATHDDADHVYGLPGLADRAEPMIFADSGLVSTPNRDYLTLRAKAFIEGKYKALRRGAIMTFTGGVKVEALNPPRGPARYTWTENNRSLVLMLTFGEKKILLAGDIEADAERWLVESGTNLRADVLKVAHHGSEGSTSELFLEAVDPRFSIISAGHKNRYGHPGGETLDRLKKRGVKIFRTDMDGEVIMKTDGEKIKWRTYSSIAAM